MGQTNTVPPKKCDTPGMYSFTGEKSPDKIHPKYKNSSEQVLLNNFRRVSDSDLCNREEGKHSRDLFEKVRVNAAFFWRFGILGGFFGL